MRKIRGTLTVKSSTMPLSTSGANATLRELFLSPLSVSSSMSHDGVFFTSDSFLFVPSMLVRLAFAMLALRICSVATDVRRFMP